VGGRQAGVWVKRLVGGWVVAYRVVDHGGDVRVAELRVSWGGAPTTVPPRGLPSRVLKHVKLSEPLREVSALRPTRARARDRDDQTVVASPGKRRGRRSHDEALLARVAADYVEGFRLDPRSPLRYVAERHGQPITRVRGWVYAARERGFLALSGRGQGRVGGTLSDRAVNVLKGLEQPLIARSGPRAIRVRDDD
jgi:hypothetical protein